MFLTGLIFTGCCVILFSHQVVAFIDTEFFKSISKINVGLETVITISFFAVIYEIGFIINRIGSLMENLLKKIKAIPFDDDYKKFNEKEKQFPDKMKMLSREYTLSRTSMTLFLILMIISLTQFFWVFSIVMTILTLIFYFSMRKHSGKIVKMMEDTK
jgi:hypothetical protein